MWAKGFELHDGRILSLANWPNQISMRERTLTRTHTHTWTLELSLMEPLLLKKEWIVKCLNCGNDAHNGPLYRTEKDYDGREHQIEVCKQCRYEDEAA